MDLLKRNEESQIEYVKRIVYGKLIDKTIDDDYTILAPLVFGKEYSSDVARRMFYGARDVLKLIDFDKINNVKDNDIIKQIEEKTLELEKEKVKFQDQKREYKALLRTDARFDHLVDEMNKSIAKLNTINPLVNKYEGVFDNNDSTEAVVILSDWHFGIEEENYWNKINIKIAKERVNTLKEYIIKYAKRHNVKTLHVELLGDMINGFLHLGTRVANEEDVIDQSMHCAELIGQLLNELAIKIPNIKVYSTIGNHGRTSPNIKESIASENFERLIPWYLNGRLKSNVELIENKFEDDIVVYKFLNETIVAVHGHNDKIGSAISDLSEMLKIFPTECHLAHYHAYQEFDKHSMTTTVNGTLSGVDSYAKAIRKTSQAIQVMMIYNEKGRECTYKIKL